MLLGLRQPQRIWVNDLGIHFSANRSNQSNGSCCCPAHRRAVAQPTTRSQHSLVSQLRHQLSGHQKPIQKNRNEHTSAIDTIHFRHIHNWCSDSSRDDDPPSKVSHSRVAYRMCPWEYVFCASLSRTGTDNNEEFANLSLPMVPRSFSQVEQPFLFVRVFLDSAIFDMILSIFSLNGNSNFRSFVFRLRASL